MAAAHDDPSVIAIMMLDGIRNQITHDQLELGRNPLDGRKIAFDRKLETRRRLEEAAHALDDLNRIDRLYRTRRPTDT